MKKITLIIALLAISMSCFAQFNKYFEPKTLRLDYYHCGTATTEDFFIDELIQEPYWAGNHNDLIDKKEYGNQLFKVYDVESGVLIFSQGYCTLFNEWQTTLEAKTTQKCYPEGIVMPFPKRSIRVEFHARNRANEWVKKFEYTVNPESYFIRNSVPNDEVFDVVYNGAPDKKIDIVVLGEGYSATERAKFDNDCAVFARELLSFEPFKSRAQEFNIRGVWRASQQSGVSMPGEHIWKNTVLKASYYTFDSERYLMIDDYQAVRDLAANVPYDYIYILSNSKKYGGGGVYNFYGISAAGDPNFAGKVYVHEFGHLFTGLGDEYVGTTGYDEFYAPGVEPWEENLTTLVNFDSKFWSKMLPKGTKIPTPDIDANENVLGVFEGGGYRAKGIYRPQRNCLMRSLQVSDHFCPVCFKTISDKMDTLTK